MSAVHDTAERLRWDEVPEAVRRHIEDALGAAVLEASSRRGGYSPSLAASCRLADGRRVFVKAVSPEQNPDSPEMLRREAAVTAALPAGAPAPRLLHLLDDGHWVASVFEHADGSLPAMPWRRDQLALVLRATWRLAELPAPSSLPSVEAHYGASLSGWRNLAASRAPDKGLDEWSARHLDRLADREPAWVDAATGPELMHGDVRSDNVLLDAQRVTFVDWPSACVGRALFDVVGMLPSVALEGGGEPEDVLRAHGGAHADSDHVTDLVVAFAGYFMDRQRLPAPPGLPTVRGFQRARGEVCVRWLKARLGWA